MDKLYELSISCSTVPRCLARSVLQQTKERISSMCKEEEEEEGKENQASVGGETKLKQLGAKKKRKILVQVPSCQCSEL